MLPSIAAILTEVELNQQIVVTEDIFRYGALNLEDPRLPMILVSITLSEATQPQSSLPEMQSPYSQASNYIIFSKSLISSPANTRASSPILQYLQLLLPGAGTAKELH